MVKKAKVWYMKSKSMVDQKQKNDWSNAKVWFIKSESMVVYVIGPNGVSWLDNIVIGGKTWLDYMADLKYGSKSKIMVEKKQKLVKISIVGLRMWLGQTVCHYWIKHVIVIRTDWVTWLIKSMVQKAKAWLIKSKSMVSYVIGLNGMSLLGKTCNCDYNWLDNMADQKYGSNSNSMVDQKQKYGWSKAKYGKNCDSMVAYVIGPNSVSLLH